MIDGLPLIDVHLHVARLPTLKLPLPAWAPFADPGALDELYDESGTIRPDRFDAYLEAEGVDLALLMSEYSPRVTGIQPVEDLRPIVRHNPDRFRLVANLNPHLHHPILAELDRQLDLGAAALKLHPVHGGFPPTEPGLYLAYQRCQELGVPVVFHSGTSIFPGATNRYADPALVDEVVRDFPDLTVVLAHGGRGWWYDAAAFLALAREHVRIELSGLPPSRLPSYYARHDLRRLAAKWIFGSDWPGVPGIAANARALTRLDLDAEQLEAIFYRNALRVYRSVTLPPAGPAPASR
jgi:predicted TIM-barrel fold metal-dependent hydrolase